MRSAAIRARNATWTIFFVMGILSMAWVPRIPEIKHSLGVNNGQFGLILLSSTTGAVVSAQICGRLVHMLGSPRVLKLSVLLMPIGLILMSLSTTRVIAMCPSLFVMAFGYVGIDVCANTQAVAIEKILEKRYMSSFHGLWSVGSFVATVFGGVIAHFISPRANLLIVGLIGLVVMQVSVRQVLSKDADGHKGDAESTGSIKLFARKYLILWLIGFALIGALLPEGAVSDWAGILLKENMGIGKGWNATGFGAFALAMIVSRLSGDRILEKFGPVKTVKLGGYIGGAAMGLGIAIAVPLSHSHQSVALVIADLGFVIAGLGIGPMVPALMVAAASLPGIAPSVALARIGIIGLGAYFIGPTVTGGLAQAINLPVAMAYPALMLVLAGWLARVMK